MTESVVVLSNCLSCSSVIGHRTRQRLLGGRQPGVVVVVVVRRQVGGKGSKRHSRSTLSTRSFGLTRLA